MSAYTVVELEMSDAECIKIALKELGYVFEEHTEAQPLVGFQGDRRQQKAHIIVRREHVGTASNDVGFLRKEDGSYMLIISDYDKRNVNFTQKIKPLYAKAKVKKQAVKMGYRVQSEVSEKGKIKIKVSQGY